MGTVSYTHLDVYKRQVVGICSANTKPKALAGVLRTGYVNYVVAPKNVVSAAAGLNNELHM